MSNSAFYGDPDGSGFDALFGLLVACKHFPCLDIILGEGHIDTSLMYVGTNLYEDNTRDVVFLCATDQYCNSQDYPLHLQSSGNKCCGDIEGCPKSLLYIHVDSGNISISCRDHKATLHKSYLHFEKSSLMVKFPINISDLSFKRVRHIMVFKDIALAHALRTFNNSKVALQSAIYAWDSCLNDNEPPGRTPFDPGSNLIAGYRVQYLGYFGTCMEINMLRRDGRGIEYTDRRCCTCSYDDHKGIGEEEVRPWGYYYVFESPVKEDDFILEEAGEFKGYKYNKELWGTSKRLYPVHEGARAGLRRNFRD